MAAHPPSLSDASCCSRAAHGILLALGVAAPLLLLAGCKPVGPDYSRPGYQAPAAYKEAGASSVQPPAAPQGGNWQPASPSDGMLRGKWWEIFRDAPLNQLEERIDVNNQSLKQATEAYLAAHDQVLSTRSALFPTLSAGMGVTHSRPGVYSSSYSSTRPNGYTDYSLTGTASWEPDLWGRVRRSVEAARANAQASAADLAAVSLSLHAELATDYYELRGVDLQVQLFQATIRSLEGQLELTRERLAGGVGTEADVAQAQTQLETVRAQLVDLNAGRAQYEHAIAVLTNQNPASFSLPAAPLNGALPQIPLGLPSQLLERRPDVAASERLTASANAQIGIAASAYYPNITLGATGGFESTHGGSWIQGPGSLWTLGAQAAELLFDAGQRHALNDQARHNYEAQAASYKATVLGAFRDVEDQLSSLRVLEDEVKVEDRAVASAQHSLDLSTQRYKGGVTSYLEVLTAETALLQNQRTATSLTTRQFVSSVSLIRALGGGWDASQLPN
jgi:NodT family efflux transporter outer membrane factor (OMF) lipoprotein